MDSKCMLQIEKTAKPVLKLDNPKKNSKSESKKIYNSKSESKSQLDSKILTHIQ